MGSPTIREVGRKLEVTFAGGTEDELVFLIPPVNAATGGAIVSLYLGIVSDIFGDPDGSMEDLLKGSLGWSVYADVDNPTEHELAQRATADELYAKANAHLRRDEVFFLANVALFWQTDGGIKAAEEFAADPTVEGGLSKALDRLYAGIGLGTLRTQDSTGNRTPSESESSPTEVPASSTPASSGS